MENWYEYHNDIFGFLSPGYELSFYICFKLLAGRNMNLYIHIFSISKNSTSLLPLFFCCNVATDWLLLAVSDSIVFCLKWSSALPLFQQNSFFIQLYLYNIACIYMLSSAKKPPTKFQPNKTTNLCNLVLLIAFFPELELISL